MTLFLQRDYFIYNRAYISPSHNPSIRLIYFIFKKFPFYDLYVKYEKYILKNLRKASIRLSLYKKYYKQMIDDEYIFLIFPILFI